MGTYVLAADSKYYISKEEDLGMQKTVNDIDVGIFLKFTGSDHTWIRLEGNLCASLATGVRFTLSDYIHDLESWSYTYNGEYTPFAPVETEEDKKLEALKATIEQAQKQIDEIVRNVR